MIYTRTELIFAVLLVASFFIEGSQADLRVRASTEKLVSSSSSTSPSASATSVFTFHPLPTPTSCASAMFLWTYSGTDGPMSLQVTDIGVSQNSPPSTTSSSIATTRDLLASSIPSRSVSSSPPGVNMTLAIDYEPLTQSFVWTSVNVSQGWYILTATIPIDDVSQNSSPFFVFTETNTSCLSTTSTSTSAPLPSPSDPYGFNASQPNVNPAPASELSSQSKSKVPTIVGVTVGMAVLVIGIILGLALRRVRSRAINGNSKNNRWNGWNFTDSRGFGANAKITRFQLSRSHLTSQPGSIATMIGPDSEDDKILGAEKSGTQLDLKVLNLSDDQGLALSDLPVLHHELSRTKPDQSYSASSSTSNLNDFGLPGNKSPSGRHSARPSISISSTVYPPSFGIPSRESPQNGVGSDITNTTGAPFFFDHASPSPNSPRSFQFPSAQTAHASSEAKQIHRQSSTRKRKPVPLYDASEEDSPVFTNSPLATFPVTGESVAFPELSHKSSFGPGGIEGKQLHYLIPDMPIIT